MWFRREQKNRRRNRGRLLDVKLRSDRVRATRTRLAAVGFCVLSGTVFGLYLFWRAGEWALDEFIYENPEFAIQSIQVQTDGVIPPEQLRQWSNVNPGMNLIALDLASVKRNLELVSTIDSVSVERILPRTLKIRVTERRPVAQVNIPTATASGGIAVSVLQLDANGYVMKPLDPRQRVISLSQMGAQLPEITGLNVYQLQAGHRVELSQAMAALQLIGAFKHSPMAGLVELRRIDVSSRGVIVATTGQGGAITFGLENFGQQLRRWREIYDLGVSENKMIASLDLAVTNNVPVRWTERLSPPAALKSINPENSWRKNV
ncbi:MAG TPA: FtsQ-type POTRA domain-containing protein [Candidatus Paceibacterota bacterium]|nr:FtsQ-type POTRA domain-containing protein [Candidatus Paceibacterota bacterium]